MGLPIIRSAVDNGLRARLRAATSRAHAGLDDDLSARLQAPGGYHAYLRGMHAFLCSLLPGVRAAAAGMDWPLPAWEQALECDLAHLRLTPLAPEPSPTSNRAATLGALYVVEGAGLGARVLLRRANALGYGQGCGATFLHLHADGDGGHGSWRCLRRPTAATLKRRAVPHGAHSAWPVGVSCARWSPE